MRWHLESEHYSLIQVGRILEQSLTLMFLYLVMCVSDDVFIGAETYDDVPSHMYKLQEGQLTCNDKTYNKRLLDGVLLSCE